MATTIKASVLHGARDLSVESRPLPTLSPTDVLISIKSTGLCGSDLHYYTHFRNGDIQVHEPLTLGHESSGIITAIGSPSVSSEYGLNVGDRVALEVGQPCEACELCCPPGTGPIGNYSGGHGEESGGKGGESTTTTSRYNICRAMRFRSSAKGWPQFPHAQGTLQEVVAHPAKWCHKLPESVDYTLGALAEPLAVAMHAAGRAGIPSCVPHSSSSMTSSRGAARVKVLVFGAGAVGLLCAAVCKSITKGDAIVVIADIQADRVKFAVENGFADAAVVVPISDKRPETIEEKLEYAKSVAERVKGAELVKGLGGQVGEVNVTFECTGVESCLQSSIYATAPGGKIMIIGMGNPIQTLPISAASLKEVDLLGVFRYANAYPKVIELLARGDPHLPDLSKLVTQRYSGLESIPMAFDMAARVKDNEGNLVLKVMIDM
ncbi:sorbitol dehydrogenase [Neurospora crassa OR74A]|uniref:Sorbitol dehydrogenase n=1 Tax=Neurospora crassa (strain ATCC 24698 / 74-OR23-1A / CBS 708.71 / DSM 1257 / FGSC 987) TaxID=367110 RepID=Q7SHA1_NEUCR|nr:sorbitol dehydrogenase [Neurospora crassa OR74A]EAA36300.3 sorbitol dehydrogenase [Neurospora crassa OR74A]|eukprot:XP_965536.3 sorbitol dehydrogenase [Neurospora crassa OR74A]